MNNLRRGIAGTWVGIGMVAVAVVAFAGLAGGMEVDASGTELATRSTSGPDIERVVRGQRGLAPREVFDLQVTAPPTPVAVLGTAHLVYELHLTNFSREAVVVARVQVVDADGAGIVLAEYSGEALGRRLSSIGATAAEGSPAGAHTLQPGVRHVVYLEIPLTPGAAPAAVEHRITYGSGGAGRDEEMTVQGGRVSVTAEPPVALGPPLRGGPWAALHQPCWERGHRRVYYAEGGRARIPGRFAMDWTRLDTEGRPTRGDDDVVANWYGHGEVVLAVADGIVAATRSDVPESTTFSDRLEHPHEEAEGNFISLDLGDGRYAFYGHLRTGSVEVEAGERVRRGQVIAQVGFTGHAGRPQLHFHVGDAIASLDAEGLPYVFDGFVVLGGYGSGDARVYGSADGGCADASAVFEGLGSTPWTPSSGGTDAHRRGEMPPPNAVVEFPTGPRGEGA